MNGDKRLNVYSYDPKPRAYGVQYRHDGKLKMAYANEEIILSAGAVSSPQVSTK